MALKATTVLAEDVKMGDFITVRNVLAGVVELMRISYIRTSGDRFTYNYCNAKTGQEVNYFSANRGEEVRIIVHA